MYKILIFIILQFSGFYIQAQIPISFQEEFIDFSIDEKYFNINGIYTFVNQQSQSENIHILYPFAMESDSIDSIRVLNLKDLKKINYKIIKNGIVFNLVFKKLDTINLNIFYRQPKLIKNRYILTTTNTWDRPLNLAKYSFTSNIDTPVKSFSYTPDSALIQGDIKISYWTKYNFLPQTDFIIELQK